MSAPAAAAAAILLAYLVGSLSFAVIVSRLMGLSDPRSYGSGNPGATNVLRSGSRAAAVLTLIGDAAKGAVGVAIGRALGAWAGYGEEVVAACALAAFVGHLAPVFFGFRGGKGVATFLGAIAALLPWAGLVAGLAWLAVAAATRFSSLASMLSAIAATLAAAIAGVAPTVLAPVGAMTALLLWRHRANIANLRAGRERRIGERA